MMQSAAWLSWTYEIFIDPASLWICRLVGCPLLIRVSGNKHGAGQPSAHTLGMWTLEILYAGRERVVEGVGVGGGSSSAWVQYI